MFGYIFPTPVPETPKPVTEEDIPKKGLIQAEFQPDSKRPAGQYRVQHVRKGRYLLLPRKGRAEHGFWVEVKDFKSVQRIDTAVPSDCDEQC